MTRAPHQQYPDDKSLQVMVMSPPSPMALPASSPLPSQQAEPWEEEQPGATQNILYFTVKGEGEP